MLSANFKQKRAAAASRGFLATARLSCNFGCFGCCGESGCVTFALNILNAQTPTALLSSAKHYVYYSNGTRSGVLFCLYGRRRRYVPQSEYGRPNGIVRCLHCGSTTSEWLPDDESCDSNTEHSCFYVVQETMLSLAGRFVHREIRCRYR